MTLLHRLNELESALWSEVEPLFERCRSDAGGFAEHANADWSPIDNGTRSLVFQSRMLWTASRIVLDRPDRRKQWIPRVVHALDMVARLWDNQHGGFRWSSAPDQSGNAEALQKHSYGQAFGLYACATAARAVPESSAISLARECASWLETRVFRDSWIVEACDQAGTPRELGEGERDIIGTPAGALSMNTAIHLLEAYTALCQADDTTAHRARLRWLLTFMTDRFVHRDGYGIPFLAERGPLSPVLVSYGHDLEAGHLLIEAAETLQDTAALEGSKQVFRRLAEHALRHGMHESGALCDSGPPETRASNRERIWWVQAEAINALTQLYTLGLPSTGQPWLDLATRIWDAAMAADQIDSTRGGWFWSTDADTDRTHQRSKVTPWKAAYHTTRCLLGTVDRLSPLSNEMA